MLAAAPALSPPARPRPALSVLLLLAAWLFLALLAVHVLVVLSCASTPALASLASPGHFFCFLLFIVLRVLSRLLLLLAPARSCFG